jgi:hypothetical protein
MGRGEITGTGERRTYWNCGEENLLEMRMEELN